MVKEKIQDSKKKTQHPALNEVKVIMVNGDVKVIKMAYQKDTLQLETDPTVHRAWQKTSTFVRSNKIDNMNKKYGKFNFGSK